jgi:predicted component of viral defense system (DUF524 family)
MSLTALQQTLKVLETQLKTNKKLADESSMLKMTGEFLNSAGGAEVIGKLLWEEFDKVRTSDQPKPKLVQEYFKIFRPMLEVRDSVAKQYADMSNLSNEDLQGVLSQLAVNLVRSDETVRSLAILEAAKSNPAMIDSMIEMLESVKAGKIVEMPRVIEAKVSLPASKPISVPVDPDDPAAGYDPDAELSEESGGEMADFLMELEKI